MMNSIFDIDATSDGAVALLPARKDKKKHRIYARVLVGELLIVVP